MLARPLPVLVTRRRGFSLVLSLTVMAMLLLLCISIAALMMVEMRVGRAAVSQARARYAALAGARIALGEIQRLMGPDQRVSATADILCDPARDNPLAADYYKNPATNQVVAHPRWVGVWNAGRAEPDSGSASAVQDPYSVVTRHNDGFLVDTRFYGKGSADADWAKTRLTTKRLMGWLASGNEALGASHPDCFTPETPLATRDSRGRAADLALLGSGVFSQATMQAGLSLSGTDGLGLRVRRVTLPGPGTTEGCGEYAYGVIDEGVKARINLANKYAKQTPSVSAISAGGYFNVVIPQRPIFDAVKSATLTRAGDALKNHSEWDARQIESMQDFGDIALLSGAGDSSISAELRAAFYHDIGFFSASVATDVVRGGLMRDLTPYVERGEVTRHANVPDSGLTDDLILFSRSPDKSDPLSGLSVADKKIAWASPRLGVIRQWYASAPTGQSVTEPAAVQAPVSSGLGVVAGDVRIPTYAGSAPAAPRSPVITAYDFSYVMAGEQIGADFFARAIKYPTFTIWNPYAVPLTVTKLTVTASSRVEPNANLYNAGNIFTCYRPVINYQVPGVTTLAPGQSIRYVPVPGQNFGTTALSSSIEVQMQPGAPALDKAYIDTTSGTRNRGTDKATGALGLSATYHWLLIQGDHNSDYPLASPCDHYALRAEIGGTANTLQYINYDGACALESNGWEYQLVDLGHSHTIQLVADAMLSGANERAHHGFRWMALDEPPSFTEIYKVNGREVTVVRKVNTQHNAFVNGNFRAALHSRHPYDRASIVRADSLVGRGLFTGDVAFDLDDPRWGGDPKEASVFFTDTAAVKRVAIVDVPRRGLGLHGVGQLQHAPFTLPAWAPGLAFGNGLLPVCGIPTDRTALTESEESAAWKKQIIPSRKIELFKNSLTQSWHNEGQGLSYLDWSYELNEAFWDRFTFSGIPMDNDGWNKKPVWNLGTDPRAARDSRYVQWAAMPTSGYFADANFDAYRASYTLLKRGVLNVNSTSVPAWISVLSAFRGVTLPGATGALGGSGLSPYSRHLYPQGGAVTAADTPQSAAVWSGGRTLTDAEIESLAQKIVYEVKKRGPFLGLADFVNRRLKSATGASPQPLSSDPYVDWTNREMDFLGTIQAAIDRTSINEKLQPADPLLAMNRTVKDDTAYKTKVPVEVINPSHKAKSKVAGAPGYLLQSDVLQQIGSALSARSDTFTVRSCGVAPDGTKVYLEWVVQRTPEPVSADPAMPVKCKSVPEGQALAGNQWMGRRFVVVSTKWLSSEQI